MTTQATKRPWNNNDPVRPFIVIDEDGQLVADCSTKLIFTRSREENKANARLIVKAVNSHDELVEALKNMMKYVNPIIKVGSGRGIDTNMQGCREYQQAKQALSKAEVL